MPIFQKKIVANYLQHQDKALLQEKWTLFRRHFLNLNVQENIRKQKEEQYQGEFLIDLFVNVLGYTKNPSPNYNLITEQKNVKDAKKADGAILLGEKVIGVIELKDTKTTDLNKVENQAFSYKNNQPDCVYVITSNFEKLRFYIDNAVEHIEFNLFKMTEKDFESLYLYLSWESISKGLPKQMKLESIAQEKDITLKLYQDYTAFKRDLYQNLLKNNPQHEEILLFKKSQKLLDRFLFLFFAEDKDLIQPNSIRKVIQGWEMLKNWNEYRPLYEHYKKYFEFFNTGIENKELKIFPYNGGLFETDTFLDSLVIDDHILHDHTLKLSDYDFNSEIDVNILGHIFENSLAELDELQKEPLSVGKRKKDGVFYTPKYITKYIIDNTVGKLCTAKKEELQLIESNYVADKKRKKDLTQALLDTLKTYRDWLLNISIIDPACGSGAFLNEALNFLIAEHQYIDELQANLLGSSLLLSDVEKSILENNLFGVDINEESVEIAKLSLWLRTARKNRKLNNLNQNIKCGNSLISDAAVADEKAFDWHKEFPKVFEKGGFDVVVGNPPYVQLQSIKEESEKLSTINFQTFEKTGDLYCLFYEKGYQILKENGLLGFITSNKWLRANYGKSLRNFLLSHTQPLLLTDLGAGIFESATVDSNVLVFQKVPFHSAFEAFDLSREKQFTDFSVYENRKIEIKPIHNESWLLTNPIEQSIKTKIETIGKPLKDWDISIYRGILTGLNEAFMIDSALKEKLIIEDAKSAKLIRPLLRGRDIQRYYSNFAKVWLISTFPALKIDINEYPAIKNYLLSIGKKLEQSGEKGSRKRTNHKWFETQDSIAYYGEFEKDAIIWKRIGSILRFSYCKDYYGLDSTCIMTGNNIKYLLCVLNSKMGHYLLKDAPKTGTGDLLVSVQAIEPLRIPTIEPSHETVFIEKADSMIDLNRQIQELSYKFQRSLVRELGLKNVSTKLENWYQLGYGDFLKELEKQKISLKLSQKQEWEEFFESEKQKAQTIQAHITQTDKEINSMVYALYDLSSEEIAIIERL